MVGDYRNKINIKKIMCRDKKIDFLFYSLSRRGFMVIVFISTLGYFRY